MSSSNKYINFEKTIGYEFSDKSLLEQALTHPSVRAKDNPDFDYERLEFLGDRVLGLIVAEMVFDEFANEDEGHLARRHSGLVCGAALCEVARTINIADYINIVSKEFSNDNLDSVLENCCEALIAAIYKDSGINEAEKFIKRFWQPLLESFEHAPKDPKSALQELAQGQGLPLPEYVEISREGAEHSPIFEIRVSLADNNFAIGKAKSKKQAEKEAAESLLQKIG